MAEEGTEQEYNLVTAEGEPLKSSHNFSGKGVATYSNNDIYDGEFKDGLREGKGKYTYSAKGSEEAPDCYQGQWLAN